jgi:chloramphenicol-sensitive protein RarD
LPLSTLGLLQYLAPSCQFLLAVLVLGEPWRPAQQVGFACIWAALAVVSLDSARARRGRAAAPEEALTPAPEASPGR